VMPSALVMRPIVPGGVMVTPVSDLRNGRYRPAAILGEDKLFPRRQEKGALSAVVHKSL